MIKTYTYTSTYRKKDGTLSTYTHNIKYVRKKREIPEEVKQEIINKWLVGVTKIRLRKDYNLSQRKLDDILLPVQLGGNFEITQGETKKEVESDLDSIPASDDELVFSPRTPQPFELDIERCKYLPMKNEIWKFVEMNEAI